MLVLNVLHFPALRFGASFSRPAFFSLYSLVVRHFQVLQIQLPISGIISTYYLNVILTDLTMTATNNDGHTMVMTATSKRWRWDARVGNIRVWSILHYSPSVFNCARYACYSAYMLSPASVCPVVCLSHGWISQKRSVMGLIRRNSN